MECKDVLTRLWEYLDEELAPEDAAAVATHLSGCPSCRPCCSFDTNFLALLRRQRARLSAPPSADRLRLRLTQARMMHRTILAAGVLLVIGGRAVAHDEKERPATVVLAQSARDSMGSVFRRYNQHWDELADLTTLERMLGTVRPTQLEYLGCLQGTVDQDTVRIESWIPAADMKQLPLRSGRKLRSGPPPDWNLAYSPVPC